MIIYSDKFQSSQKLTTPTLVIIRRWVWVKTMKMGDRDNIESENNENENDGRVKTIRRRVIGQKKKSVFIVIRPTLLFHPDPNTSLFIVKFWNFLINKLIIRPSNPLFLAGDNNRGETIHRDAGESRFTGLDSMFNLLRVNFGSIQF